MPRRVSNPPNPWQSAHVEWLEEPPAAELEVHEEEARSILSRNDSPDVGFRFSVNPYRGCFHGCAYCLAGDTGVLMADGSSRPIAELRPGDAVYGSVEDRGARRFVRTQVLDHWRVVKPAWRVLLTLGTELVASGDHRFLTDHGWRHVAPSVEGPRPHLSHHDRLIGVGLDRDLHVQSVEPLGEEVPLFDITTGTGDYVANGVVSHNCYARPSHQYLGFGAGTDFERRIVVKTNAPELLRRELLKKSWEGETIAFSGNTDCYQPLEASYGLTRRCLEVCHEFRNPVGVITKGALIARDVELLAALARDADAFVNVSIPFARDDAARAMEPYAASTTRRFETLRRLSDAGVPTGIGIAPVIPGLNDSDLPELLERAKEAGARRAFLVLVRLPAEVLPVFAERLGEAFPGRARKVLNAIQEVRAGKLYDPAFGARMRGSGPRWEAIDRLFETTCRRLGLNAERKAPAGPSTFRRPAELPGGQKLLFDGIA